MSAAYPPPGADRRSDLFGHPRALSFLFATEMWERFSYYGMRALLVLYMVNHLLVAGRADNVWGLQPLKHGFESLFGPLEIQPLASQIYGFYTGLVYLTPLLGGYIADRWFGRKRTVIAGAVLMALGHFAMAFEPMFLLALTLLILGNGAFKPNMATQVGRLYAPEDTRRDRAFSIFYVGVNLGAFLAPLVCGTLGEEVGWHYGFASAGVGMTLGLCIYLCAWRLLPDDRPARRAEPPPPLAPREKRALAGIFIMFLPVSLFWAAYEQSGNTIALWANDSTDRAVDLFFWRGEVPATWFQALNPFLIFAFTPFIVALWGRQAKYAGEPSTPAKMAIGCFGVALAYLVMVAAAWHADGEKSHWLWLFVYFIILTIAELYMSPTALSLVSRVAPVRLLSLTMGLWLATSFVGNFLSGWLGMFWATMSPAQFFFMLAAIAALAGCVILASAGSYTGSGVN